MRLLIILHIIINSYTGSTPKLNGRQFKSVADSTLIKLKAIKSKIDRYVNKHEKQIIILVKVPGKKNLIRVINKKWPDEIEDTYNIVKDESGKIVFILRTPFSESGDWGIIYKHYFDKDGNTLAFYRSESIFDDTVTGGVVRETLLKYYDGSFKNISQLKALLNVNNKPIKGKQKEFEFRNYKYTIYKNLSDCISGYNIRVRK